jgi:hypothetical protein
MPAFRQRMRAIAQERRRFGYRPLHVLLKREGYNLTRVMNIVGIKPLIVATAA